jgi:hypothetical protein
LLVGYRPTAQLIFPAVWREPWGLTRIDVVTLNAVSFLADQ